jgi:hypothetical protein
MHGRRSSVAGHVGMHEAWVQPCHADAPGLGVHGPRLPGCVHGGLGHAVADPAPGVVVGDRAHAAGQDADLSTLGYPVHQGWQRCDRVGEAVAARGLDGLVQLLQSGGFHVLTLSLKVNWKSGSGRERAAERQRGHGHPWPLDDSSCPSDPDPLTSIPQIPAGTSSAVRGR